MSDVKEKKYNLSELKLNMKVYKSQLSKVYDTWIILYRPKGVEMDEDGIIGFIGKETNQESDKLYTEDNIIIPVFNDSIELEGDIYYEE